MKSYKEYRHQENPEEKKFHDTFIEKHGHEIDWLIFPTDSNHKPASVLDEREERVTVSIIQWLGSPVGQTFLRDLGYTKEEK